MRKATIHGFKAPYLYLRGNGNYLYRRAIPAEHQDLAGGRTEFKESLRTKNHHVAIVRYGETRSKYEAIFEQIRNGIALKDQKAPSVEQLKAKAASYKLTYKSVDEHLASPNLRDIAQRIGIWAEQGKPAGIEMDAIFGSLRDDTTIRQALKFYEEQNRDSLIGLTPREASKKLTPVRGGLTGTFDTVTGLPAPTIFLAVEAGYDANNAWLESIKYRDFADAGLTPNQIATGQGLDTILPGSPLFLAVANLPTDAAARHAFDQLSGEVYASARTAMIEDSRFLRSAVDDRLRAAFDGVGAVFMPVMAYADGCSQYVPATTDRFAVWSQAFGSWGHWNSDGNAARLNRSTGGFFVGADAPVFDTWRFGAVAGYSRTTFNARDRASLGSSDNFHLGLYGATRWGDLAFRTGAAYTWHDIAIDRSVVFPGFTDSLKGEYDAGTAQIFGELAYGFSAGGARLEPFANLAYINLHTDGFTEQGGAAALANPSANTGATFTTLGLRASTTFDLGATAVTAKGMLGWRHTFGDATPDAAMRFASGSDAFSIAGVPVTRSAAVIEAGARLRAVAQRRARRLLWRTVRLRHHRPDLPRKLQREVLTRGEGAKSFK